MSASKGLKRTSVSQCAVNDRLMGKLAGDVTNAVTQNRNKKLWCRKPDPAGEREAVFFCTVIPHLSTAGFGDFMGWQSQARR